MLWELPVTFLHTKITQSITLQVMYFKNLQAFCKHSTYKTAIYKTLQPILTIPTLLFLLFTISKTVQNKGFVFVECWELYLI